MKIAPFDMPHPTGDGSTEFPGYEVAGRGICILTGSNGAGKTTLLRFLRTNPQLVNSSRGRNVEMAILDQMYERLLFPYKPVWWNISLPKILSDGISSREAMQLAKQKLAEFQLNLHSGIYPEGLSGGEKHLVLILRLSLCNHGILLLDEPATGVDASRVSILWTTISHLVSTTNKQVILSTHRDFPPWERQNPLTFTGIRGAPLCIETVVPNNGESHESE